jgi:hypothetical protein
MCSPVQDKEMGFTGAIEKIILGKKLTRVEWRNMGTYIVLHEGILKIKKSDGFHPLLVSEGDLRGDDWIVVEESRDRNSN